MKPSSSVCCGQDGPSEPITPSRAGGLKGNRRGRYKGSWDKGWDFMRTQASIATDPTAGPTFRRSAMEFPRNFFCIVCNRLALTLKSQHQLDVRFHFPRLARVSSPPDSWQWQVE